ncbi:RidA family protein [Streptomyces sp. NPDC003247]|uniref:RidA family protein n=1 Tax=Streptomyces sp. NPDC003247 TaxID=3364677 RepID=UPI00368D072B
MTAAQPRAPRRGGQAVVGRGPDPAGQARAAFRALHARLPDPGGVRLTEYVTVAALDAYPEVEAARTAVFPGAGEDLRTVVVEALPDPGALLAVHAGPGTDASGAGTVRLPTVLPLDDRGDLVHPDDFVAQYAYCLSRAGRLLKRAGLSLDQAVTTFDYTTPATRRAYPRCAGPRRELLGGAGVFPGAGGILMSRLHAPGVLVALDVTASRHPPAAVNPGWRRYDTLTYSPGVLAGRTLHMSGFAALDMETQRALYPGDPVAQTEAVLAAVLEVVAAAGGSPGDLVSVEEYLCPAALGERAAVAAAHARTLGPGPRPVVTTVGCAGLLRREFLTEVFPTAVLRGTPPAEPAEPVAPAGPAASAEPVALPGGTR